MIFGDGALSEEVFAFYSTPIPDRKMAVFCDNSPLKNAHASWPILL
jgi:hypothetical protein